jgi:hypothetical protein
MLWKFNSVYNPKLQLADHAMPVNYKIPVPPANVTRVDPAKLFVHEPRAAKEGLSVIRQRAL